MGRYRIEYTRNKCIGAFSCVSIDSDNWTMNDDNKADLVNGKKIQEEKDGQDEIWAVEVELDDPKNLVAGAQACPVNVIKVIDLQTGQVLAP
ncbi:MAG: ferredoxin [Candidatus Aenigmatarchaeota archaeon]|nr:MAG: ferredoxin [Candidatus Aenigmarchaeota archaeon]